jgi:hypothetical protein
MDVRRGIVLFAGEYAASVIDSELQGLRSPALLARISAEDSAMKFRRDAEYRRGNG